MSHSHKTEVTDPTARRYHELLEGSWTCKTEDDREFILVSELEIWMHRHDTNRQQPNGGILLDHAYNQRNKINETNWQIVSSQGDSRCVLVFALLLKLGYGHLIHIFKRMEINDRNIGALSPMGEKAISEALFRQGPKYGHSAEEFEEIARQFAHYQWAFAPVNIEVRLRPRPELPCSQNLPLLQEGDHQ